MGGRSLPNLKQSKQIIKEGVAFKVKGAKPKINQHRPPLMPKKKQNEMPHHESNMKNRRTVEELSPFNI